MRAALAVTVTVLLLAATAPAQAAKEWAPLDAVKDLVAWFTEINAEFDEIVENEKRGQLLRAVDRLRKSLYRLEIDVDFLMGSIPEDPPDEAQGKYIQQQADEMLESVEALSERLVEFGADLRLNDPDEVIDVERRLTYGINTRRVVLTEIDAAVYRVRKGEGEWDAAYLKGRLQEGLKAVRGAQLAVTEFQRKLQAEAPTDG